MKRLFGLTLMTLAPLVAAQEAVVTLRATVTGNQEQPKVMYIVPWQQPGSTEFDYEPGSSFAAELFSPLDRDEFVRGLNYQAAISTGVDDSTDER